MNSAAVFPPTSGGGRGGHSTTGTEEDFFSFLDRYHTFWGAVGGCAMRGGGDNRRRERESGD